MHDKTIAVDDTAVAALKQAKVANDVIDAARAAGTMTRHTVVGWLVAGYRGSVMSKRQQQAFEAALGI